MNPTPFPVVLAGCGGMSGTWLQAMTAHPDLAVVGLVDLNADVARARAAEFGLSGTAAVETDLDAALARLRPAMVFDCTVPAAHRFVATTALRHGCHVLGEKPLADSLENARAILRAAREAGRLHAVIQNQRYYNGIRRVRAFLDSGALGRITTLHCDFILGAHFGGFRDEMEHVLLLDMAIHTFDEARFLLGDAAARTALCHEWNPPGSWYRHGASAAAVFEMAGDAVFTYRGSWCAEGVNTSWSGAWRIVGERGSLWWDGAEEFRAEVVAADPGHNLVRAFAPVPVPPLDLPEKSHGHASIIAEFVRCVRAGTLPETVGTSNFHSLAMVFAAIESARDGRRVAVAAE